jgi:hypothetical protein
MAPRRFANNSTRHAANGNSSEIMLILYIVLTLIGLSLWLWLVISIWRISKLGAMLTLLFVFPALYWAYRLWDDQEANIRTPFIINLVINLIALPVAIGTDNDNALYGAENMQKKGRAAELARRNNSEMVRWCKEKNDAIYDPVIGTCVEPDKAEVLAQSVQENVFGQLEKHLVQSGLNGELDASTTAELAKLKAAPEIADATNYHFLPLSMAQAPITVLLCVSESACAKTERQARESGTDLAIRNRNLMLLVQPQALDDARLKILKKAFSTFRAA